jgi:hypothetical protein
MVKKNNRLKNVGKEKFIKIISEKPSIKDENSLVERCKFNFSYLDFSQDISGSCEQSELIALVGKKLLDFSRSSLKYWQGEKIGSGKQAVLEVYGSFPKHSNFIEPKNIPYEALWARFRLDSTKRLIGFVIPDEYHNTKHDKLNYFFDSNTFYVVFLDPEHNFYPIKSK